MLHSEQLVERQRGETQYHQSCLHTGHDWRPYKRFAFENRMPRREFTSDS